MSAELTPQPINLDATSHVLAVGASTHLDPDTHRDTTTQMAEMLPPSALYEHISSLIELLGPTEIHRLLSESIDYLDPSAMRAMVQHLNRELEKLGHPQMLEPRPQLFKRPRR